MAPMYLGGGDGLTICVGKGEKKLSFSLEELQPEELNKVYLFNFLFAFLVFIEHFFSFSQAIQINPEFGWQELAGRIGETKLKGRLT